MDWKEHGVKIVHAGELDMNTPQTSGMTRAAAITHARTIRAKVGLLELAKHLGNVSQACKIMGYSRDRSIASEPPANQSGATTSAVVPRYRSPPTLRKRQAMRQRLIRASRSMTVTCERLQFTQRMLVGRSLKAIPQLCDGDHALSRIRQPHNYMAISMVPAADPLI